eukprot:scaffold2917_cov191-Amphora_coffeaeformis.AAC.52
MLRQCERINRPIHRYCLRQTVDYIETCRASRRRGKRNSVDSLIVLQKVQHVIQNIVLLEQMNR